MLIFFSFCGILIFLYLLSVLLNYVFLRIGEQKLEQPKAYSNNSSSSRNQHRRANFSSSTPPNLRSNSKVLLNLKNQNYPEWFIKIVNIINVVRKNTWKSSVHFLKYLISLTRPPVEEAASISKTDSKNNSVEKIDILTDELVDNLENKTDKDEVNNSFKSVNIERELTPFEVQEKRILRKLKQKDRMDDWDIWFELAYLYEKYDEFDKASDINCFIMKNGGEKDKERAAQNLIGLG